jgi:hypothetical protein
LSGRRAQPADQPRTRGPPVSLHRDWRHAEHFRNVVLCQPAEESEVDDACRARVGLLRAFPAYELLAAPLTFDRSMWYADTGYAALAVPLAIAAYGFWVSLGGRERITLQTAEAA